MTEGTRAIRRNTRVSLCIEVLCDVNVPKAFVQLVVSIPGRQGTVIRTWMTTPDGYLDENAVKDMVSYVNLSVLDAVACEGGAQGVLPLG